MGYWTSRDIKLAGMRDIPIWSAFCLPDRYDLVVGGVFPETPIITLHPNYIAAKAIAGKLIENGVFKRVQ